MMPKTLFILLGWLGKENNQRNASSKLDEDDALEKKPSNAGDDGNRKVMETEEQQVIPGMLPSSIVDPLAAREKYVLFISFSVMSFLGCLVH